MDIKNKKLLEIGTRIKEIRNSPGIPLKAVSSYLNLTPQAYGNIENGKQILGLLEF
jgi:transcriptional regulator with XRE-family HTH domain